VVVRRIVVARVGPHPAADDLVQEILVRVLAASGRIEPGMLEPYAVVTARNVIASIWRDDASISGSTRCSQTIGTGATRTVAGRLEVVRAEPRSLTAGRSVASSGTEKSRATTP
jgi:DNA-directed RNA polymerase specialized sigma24 family protein